MHPRKSGRDSSSEGDFFHLFERGVRAGVSKKAFLRSVDEMRPLVYELLCDHYRDPYYAKLLYLKMTNFLISQYHLVSQHLYLVSKPVTLMVDPSNACQLRCPGCVHSSNKDYSRDFLWPSAIMKAPVYRGLLQEHGPFALSTVLYNYGEPLLNPDIADFVLAANSHAMSSFFSSNVSMDFDVERFVQAGPDHIILSIDGITQDSYSKFRKRGDLSLALANVRRLVEAKRNHGFTRPILAWRFFTFEHNLHEVDRAIDLARELGVDYLLVSTPSDVSCDDPTVKVATSEREGVYRFVETHATRRSPKRILERLAYHHEVEQLFAEDWSSRSGGEDHDEVKKGSGTCIWLYHSMSVDAAGRVMPCCIVPRTNQHLVFGDLSEKQSHPFNSASYVRARLSFTDRQAFEESSAAGGQEPFCSICPQPPPLSYGLPNALEDLFDLDFRDAVFSPANKMLWNLFR